VAHITPGCTGSAIKPGRPVTQSLSKRIRLLLDLTGNGQERPIDVQVAIMKSVCVTAAGESHEDLDNLRLQGKEREAIREATRMLKRDFPVKEVILFGSKVRGDSDEDSDIDLFPVTERPIHWRERQSIVHALFDLGMKYDVIFSILDAPEEEVRGGMFSASPIHEEITREGVPAL